MAEVNAKDLTTKTSPASTDSMLLFGTTSNEGGKITVDNMKDWVLSGLSTKTFPNQVGGSSAATLLSQLSTLNSNLSNVGTSHRTNSYCETDEWHLKVGRMVFIHVEMTPTTTINTSTSTVWYMSSSLWAKAGVRSLVVDTSSANAQAGTTLNRVAAIVRYDNECSITFYGAYTQGVKYAADFAYISES